MTHCPHCGRTMPGSVFALCGECREQIVSLGPGDPRYFWYMRAIRAFYFERMKRMYCCQSSRLK